MRLKIKQWREERSIFRMYGKYFIVKILFAKMFKLYDFFAPGIRLHSGW